MASSNARSASEAATARDELAQFGSDVDGNVGTASTTPYGALRADTAEVLLDADVDTDDDEAVPSSRGRNTAESDSLLSPSSSRTSGSKHKARKAAADASLGIVVEDGVIATTVPVRVSVSAASADSKSISADGPGGNKPSGVVVYDEDAKKEKAPAAPKPITPLPKMKVALVGMVLFTDTFSQLLIFPFLPFMVHDFFPHLDKHELGYYAGYLGGCFYIGSLCFNVFWGQQADKYGRRPIMMLGMLGTVLSTIAFGFSESFRWALLIRFVWGSANGNIGVAKTYLSEVCDDSNSPQAFSITGMLVGLGRVFGPVIGGFLAQPALKYPNTFGRLPVFVSYPYLLPCLFAASFGLCLLVCVYFYMEETLKKPAPLPGQRLWLRIKTVFGRRDTDWEGEMERVESARDGKKDKDEPKPLDLLRDRTIFLASLLYGLLAMTALVSNELFPLWMVAKPRHHGFGMGTDDIGVIMSCVGPTQIAYQLLIYPSLVQKWGVKWLFVICALCFSGSLFFFPYVELTQQWNWPHWQVWTVMYLTLIFMVNVRNTCFTCIFVFVANSCVSSVRGTVTGIGQTFASAGRAMGPTFGASAFAWSMSSGHAWPLNFHFMWYVLGGFAILLAYTAYLLPDSIVKRKDAAKAGSSAPSASGPTHLHMHKSDGAAAAGGAPVKDSPAIASVAAISKALSSGDQPSSGGSKRRK